MNIQQIKQARKRHLQDFAKQITPKPKALDVTLPTVAQEKKKRGIPIPPNLADLINKFG